MTRHGSLKNIYHILTPLSLQRVIDFKRRSQWYKLSKVVENYYHGRECTDEEKECLLFLRKHHYNLNATKLLYLSGISEPYLHRFESLPVMFSQEKRLPYIIHEGKPLFFPRGISEEQVRYSYSQFVSEMDSQSPHLYCANPNELRNRILFDCGVAEGLFPLTYIDYFKKVVLFECDPVWREPLEATFSPYKEKVQIVSSYVSDSVSKDTITLDYYATSKQIYPTYIKMDIEGYEERAIAGATEILSKSDDIICSICTYHTPSAEMNIKQAMGRYGFSPSYNHGYMFFFYEDNIQPPYLRRGVVRFYKRK